MNLSSVSSPRGDSPLSFTTTTTTTSAGGVGTVAREAMSSSSPSSASSATFTAAHLPSTSLQEVMDGMRGVDPSLVSVQGWSALSNDVQGLLKQRAPMMPIAQRIEMMRMYNRLYAQIQENWGRASSEIQRELSPRSSGAPSVVELPSDSESDTDSSVNGSSNAGSSPLFDGSSSDEEEGADRVNEPGDDGEVELATSLDSSRVIEEEGYDSGEEGDDERDDAPSVTGTSTGSGVSSSDEVDSSDDEGRFFSFDEAEDAEDSDDESDATPPVRRTSTSSGAPSDDEVDSSDDEGGFYSCGEAEEGGGSDDESDATPPVRRTSTGSGVSSSDEVNSNDSEEETPTSAQSKNEADELAISRDSSEVSGEESDPEPLSIEPSPEVDTHELTPAGQELLDEINSVEVQQQALNTPIEAHRSYLHTLLEWLNLFQAQYLAVINQLSFKDKSDVGEAYLAKKREIQSELDRLSTEPVANEPASFLGDTYTIVRSVDQAVVRMRDTDNQERQIQFEVLGDDLVGLRELGRPSASIVINVNELARHISIQQALQPQARVWQGSQKLNELRCQFPFMPIMLIIQHLIFGHGIGGRLIATPPADSGKVEEID